MNPDKVFEYLYLNTLTSPDAVGLQIHIITPAAFENRWPSMDFIFGFSSLGANGERIVAGHSKNKKKNYTFTLWLVCSMAWILNLKRKKTVFRWVRDTFELYSY